jgi:predicted N-acyltransferase
MPAAKLELDFPSFEEYMQTRLSRVFRKSLRRKFKESASLTALEALEMSVHTDITEIVDEIYPLYLQTLSRAEFSFEVLTREFLCRIGQEMPDRVRFFVWRQNGKAVAFNLCMIHDAVIYDIDIGLDYAVALDLHLYFITWRDIIQWAIDNQFKTYYTAQLNYDPKYHFRLDLAPLDLYACHTSALINPIFRLALQFLQPARHDPILKKFRNAHEL